MRMEIVKLDGPGYRKFALTTGAILAVLFGLLIPYIFGFNYPKWPWIIAGVLGSWGLIAPKTLAPVYFGWMKFGNIMSSITTPIIMGIMFYGVFLPMGILLKILGKDPMRRKRDQTVSSYRIKSNPEPKDNVEHPY